MNDQTVQNPAQNSTQDPKAASASVGGVVTPQDPGLPSTVPAVDDQSAATGASTVPAADSGQPSSQPAPVQQDAQGAQAPGQGGPAQAPAQDAGGGAKGGDNSLASLAKKLSSWKDDFLKNDKGKAKGKATATPSDQPSDDAGSAAMSAADDTAAASQKEKTSSQQPPQTDTASVEPPAKENIDEEIEKIKKEIKKEGEAAKGTASGVVTSDDSQGADGGSQAAAQASQAQQPSDEPSDVSGSFDYPSVADSTSSDDASAEEPAEIAPTQAPGSGTTTDTTAPAADTAAVTDQPADTASPLDEIQASVQQDETAKPEDETAKPMQPPEEPVATAAPAEPVQPLEEPVATAAAEPVLPAQDEVPTPKQPESKTSSPTPKKTDTEKPMVSSAASPAPKSMIEKPKSAKPGKYPFTIENLLDLVVEKDASDLHITVGYPAMVRIDGNLEPVSSDLVDQKTSLDLILPVLAENKRELLEVNREVDLSYAHKESARFRINAYYERGNPAAAFRLIPNRIRTIEELKLPGIYHQFTKLPQGFVLVTGPTGHGKSTTLAAMLQEINETYPKHIITIEDPIEYIYSPAKALVDQREMHEDTHSWEIALRSALREDPDVVLVGEMRDFETIASAITLAETGHLVFATLHTNNAAQTIDRIIDVFPEHQQSQVRTQLANIIEAVISQRLLPIIGGGRRAVSEVLLCTPAVRNLVREGKTHQIDNVIQTSKDIGMRSLEQSLVELVREGSITVEDAEANAIHPEEITRLMRS